MFPKKFYWLTKRELFWVILLPAAVQIFFPRLWLDPFLPVLFLFAWDDRAFPFFLPLIIWSIIKSLLAGTNAGGEMAALGAAWYFLTVFPSRTRREKTLGVLGGSFLFLFVETIVPGFRMNWGDGMFFKFFVIFAVLNLVICWTGYCIKNSYLNTIEQWRTV